MAPVFDLCAPFPTAPRAELRMGVRNFAPDFASAWPSVGADTRPTWATRREGAALLVVEASWPYELSAVVANHAWEALRRGLHSAQRADRPAKLMQVYTYMQFSFDWSAPRETPLPPGMDRMVGRKGEWRSFSTIYATHGIFLNYGNVRREVYPL